MATLENILAALGVYSIIEISAWYASYSNFTFASASQRHIIKVVSAYTGYAYALDIDVSAGKTYTNYYKCSSWSGWK